MEIIQGLCLNIVTFGGRRSIKEIGKIVYNDKLHYEIVLGNVHAKVPTNSEPEEINFR